MSTAIRFFPTKRHSYVADASDTHACILNKYNVVDLHLLIVTREFEHQESLVSCGRFSRLWRCLGEYDSLGFYNSARCPVRANPISTCRSCRCRCPSTARHTPRPSNHCLTQPASHPGAIVESADLPFAHSLVFWDPAQVVDCEAMALTSWTHYMQMLRRHELGPPPGPDDRMAGSYNLLVTRRWMLLVPRVRECFQSISFNSLAFAGALLVQDPAQMDELRAAGPFAALEWVAAARG